MRSAARRDEIANYRLESESFDDRLLVERR
jgi:hypothetical protein